jgi:hypothetical protein
VERGGGASCHLQEASREIKSRGGRSVKIKEGKTPMKIFER